MRRNESPPPRSALLLRQRARAVAMLAALTCALVGLARTLDEAGPATGASCWLRVSASGDTLVCDVDGGSNRAPFPVSLALALGAPFDVNAADVAALTRLRGIGPARAERIVALREARGGFCALEELSAAHGIGPATVERLRTRLRVVPPPGRRCP